jgi:pimeloyl-ACP methyl ester carboxylesterase
MWDQRGEGKTYEKHGDSIAKTMTIDRMANDGIEISKFLLKHLHKQKLILLGHSWGSVLGIRMIHTAPQLFSVYVGTGQVTNLPHQLEAAYPSLLELAESNPDAKQDLTAIGPPPWRSRAELDVIERWEGELEPPQDPPTEEDQQTWMLLPMPDGPDYLDEGEEFSTRLLAAALDKEDLPKLATRFKVPVVFIQGKMDLLTTTALVREYFNKIVAPAKHLIELPGTGHNAIFSSREPFLAQLLDAVRPLALLNEH